MRLRYRARLYVLVFTALLLTAPVCAHSAEVGKTVSVVGKVLVIHEEQGNQRPLMVPDPVFLNDKVSSGMDSRAKFMMIDDSILKLGPSSNIKLTEMVVGLQDQQTTIQHLKGQLRILIGKKLKPKSRFEVHTPVAVAGVRGTDFEVWVIKDGKTAVRVFEGEVVVFNINRQIAGEVMLTKNQYTIVEKDKPPTEPRFIPGHLSTESVFGEKEQSDEEKQTEEPETVELKQDGQRIYEGVKAPTDMTGNQNESLDNALDQVEVSQVSQQDYSDNSAAGQYVLQELGIDPDLARAHRVPGNVINKVMNSVTGEVTGVGPSTTVPQPIYNSSPVLFDIQFPSQ